MILIPKPREISYGEGTFACTFGTYIVCEGRAEVLFARRLRDCINHWAGLHLTVVRGKARRSDIVLGLDAGLKEQEYTLTIEPGGVRVLGGDGAGLMYGVETLCQIVEQQGALLPAVTIRDFPQIPRRGYYLDQTRGRVLKLEELKRIVDRLCRFKLNEFQLYVEHTYLFRDLSEMWRDTTPLTAEEIMELDDYCAERHIDLVPSLASFGHLYMLLSDRCY
ncbi:MAG: beta-N-acetylhexosaminidase, partial [Acetatifactor sp.]|nr:beta-N-acetylhexosaminidase [Acetatifactor sp.]